MSEVVDEKIKRRGEMKHENFGCLVDGVCEKFFTKDRRELTKWE